MRVWTITGFKGKQPTGTAAVVIADTAEYAALLLNAALAEAGLPRSVKPEDFTYQSPRNPRAVILCDGDY